MKDDEEVEVDVVGRADSSLGDDAGPDESSKVEMLFTVLRGDVDQTFEGVIRKKQQQRSRNRRQW